MRETSRRQLLKGIGGIGAGVAVGAVGGGTALADATAARRVDGKPPGSVLWQAHAGTATQMEFLDIVAGYGMVYACNAPATGATSVCAFDADTGARAWQLNSDLYQLAAAGPGAVFLGVTVPGSGFTAAVGIVALGAANGGTLWSFNSGQPNASISYSDGMVITNSYGSVTALDARTGRLAWGSGPNSYVPTVLAEGGTVYAAGYASGNGGMPGPWQFFAMNISTGTGRWRFTGFSGVLSGLAVSDGVVCGSQWPAIQPPSMFALDASDGHRLWRASSNTAVEVINGGCVISTDLGAQTDDGPTRLYARHLSSGASVWHRTLGKNVQLMTSQGGALYAGGGRDNLITALAAGTGKELWACRLSAPAFAAAATGGVLYVIDANATVSAIRA
jgi:outer membrane protein assembly factor BamB